MSAAWIERSATELRRLIQGAGEVIIVGPLNTAYRVEAPEGQVFVRERTLEDEEYGQSFCAERWVGPHLDPSVGIPAVLQIVVDEAGRERYGVFEWVDHEVFEWTTELAVELAGLLARIHGSAGTGFGNLPGPYEAGEPGPFLAALLAREVAVLAAAGELSPSLAERLAVLGAELPDLFCDDRPRLCHGDVHAHNVLRRPAGELVLIDWEASRYRVRAADFNQLHLGWLAPGLEAEVRRSYGELASLDATLFERQVQALRVLWHVRTCAFDVTVLGRDPLAEQGHLVSASSLLEGM